jgi:hypothetical protein
MTDRVIQISDSFWNIRGEFKIGGVLNIGTHASLVKLESGNFALLDAYTLTGDVKDQIDALTGNGADIEAVINLHPFHTVHVEWAHQQYPHANHYGTKRHVEKFPNLAWQPELTESIECATLFADDFEFSVPAGVDFISSNDKLHFSSVLAYHKDSKTIHSDDTLMYLQLGGVLGKLKKLEVSFHMTLGKTLEKREGAVSDFREWAVQLAEDWKDAENLCAAHSATLLGCENKGLPIAGEILSALDKVEKVLAKHQKQFG